MQPTGSTKIRGHRIIRNNRRVHVQELIAWGLGKKTVAESTESAGLVHTLKTMMEGQKQAAEDMKIAQIKLDEQRAQHLADIQRTREQDEEAKNDIRNKTNKLRDMQRSTD